MNKCIECGNECKPFKTGKYPKTCSKECLSVVRGRNGTRNNQMKKGWGNKNAQALT